MSRHLWGKGPAQAQPTRGKPAARSRDRARSTWLHDVACAGRLLRAWALLVATAIARPPAQAAEPPTYADLQPLFRQTCAACHSGAQPAAGLALDSLQGLLKGSARGSVVLAGQPARSELLRRLKGESQPRMPMTGPPWVPAEDIARIERWIAHGLPAGAPVLAAATAAAPAAPPAGQAVTWAHVAPVFARHCVRCHSPQGQMGPAPEAYVLSSHAAAVSAEDRVRVVPGRPEASELMRRIRGHAQPRMPFDGPPWLDEASERLIARWITDGARDASGRPTSVPAGARIRLRGVMSPDGSLDGLALPASGGRRDRVPVPGSPMELRGRLLPDGSIEVERMRGR